MILSKGIKMKPKIAQSHHHDIFSTSIIYYKEYPYFIKDKELIK